MTLVSDTARLVHAAWHPLRRSAIGSLSAVPLLLLVVWPIVLICLLLVGWVYYPARYNGCDAAIGYMFLLQACAGPHFMMLDLALTCTRTAQLWERFVLKAWLGIVVIWGVLGGFVLWLIEATGWTLVIWGRSEAYIHIAGIFYIAVAIILWVIGRRIYLSAKALHEKGHGALSLLAYVSFWVMFVSSWVLSSLMVGEVVAWGIGVNRIDVRVAAETFLFVVFKSDQTGI